MKHTFASLFLSKTTTHTLSKLNFGFATTSNDYRSNARNVYADVQYCRADKNVDFPEASSASLADRVAADDLPLIKLATSPRSPA
jgi:hypothetical protein